MNITQLLATMALEVHDLATPDEVVDRVGDFARMAVGADDAGILLTARRGGIETIAATSERVMEMHGSQVETSEGPCLDSIYEGAATYRCDDVTVDPRWPVWAPLAAGLGFRSILSVRLETNDRKLGSLNAYAAEPQAFSSDDAHTLEFLAAHAAVAISASRHGVQLETALDSRTVIGQAQGMLMLAFDLTADSAFLYMRRLSQESNRKLAAIAQDILDQRQDLLARVTQVSSA